MNLYESPCGYFDRLTSNQEIYSFPDEDELKDLIPDEIIRSAEKRYGKKVTRQEFFYTIQLEEGFRRTDNIIYRATCPECKKCIPI